MAKTKIAWTDYTHNPWRGCVKVAPECANCYADDLSKRNPQILGRWGTEASGGFRTVAAESYWRQLSSWNEQAKANAGNGLGHWPRVFMASMADIFEEWNGPMLDVQGRPLIFAGPRRIECWKPLDPHDRGGGIDPVTMRDVRYRVFDAIVENEWLDFLVLTKRPENIHPMLTDWLINHARGGLSRLLPLRNLWLGTSAGCQATLDTAAPALLSHAQQWARIAFLSCEPQIERIDVGRYVPSPDGFVAPDLSNGAVHMSEGAVGGGGYLNWIIQGGESGPHARDFDVGWLYDMKDQLAETAAVANIAHFVKQMGDKPVIASGYSGNEERFKWPVGWSVEETKTVISLTARAGADPGEWPDELQIQEFPK